MDKLFAEFSWIFVEETETKWLCIFKDKTLDMSPTKHMSKICQQYYIEKYVLHTSAYIEKRLRFNL
jgi:hypothetical protein